MDRAAVLSNRPAAAARLEALLPNIPVKSHEFCNSLIHYARKADQDLSIGRADWLAKMIVEAEARIARAANGNEPRAKIAVGDCSGINTLFDKAREHLKAPKIVIKADETIGEYVRLTVAGETAAVPGAINVLVENPPQALQRDESDTRQWFGRVLKDGTLEVSPRFKRDPRVAVVSQMVAKFAENPAMGAKESARLTGKCVFCHTKIKDERSTQVGYGQKCASRFGLTWG